MPLPALTFAALDADPTDILASVPAAPGVGQFLGPEGRNLLLAPAANLRKWAGAHLGQGKPPAPGRRPKTNLSGIATSLGWARTSSPFGQRLLYERLIAPLVPVAERRDLKPPVFLHLDPEDRFPRVTVRGADDGVEGLFGPFRSRRGAEKARDEVNRLFALRPCDFAFEPDQALPLGLGCLYAQVRSCAAPCLARLSERDYRALAARAAGWLTDPGTRSDAPPSVPATVVRVQGSRMVVVSVGRTGIDLFPVGEGRVLENATVRTTPEEIEAAAARLEWPPADAHGPDDWLWLAGWLARPRGRGSCIPVGNPSEHDALAAAIRSALPPRFARPSGDGNVGTSRGEA